MRIPSSPLLTVLLILTLASPAPAQIVISANDNKVVRVNGAVQVVPTPPPDTLTVIDLKAIPPRAIAEIPVPNSYEGPPLSVAITPDERLALVTAGRRIDPADRTKIANDNRVSVIDLESRPPRVIATLEAGAAAAGVSINRQGTLALVANRAEGTVSVFTIQGKTVAAAGKVAVGPATSGPSHVMFTPDGKTALVTREIDHIVSVLAIDGVKVEYTKRDLTAGIRPYALDISKDGMVAAVANWGRGSGDTDTVSLIDLTANPIRVAETISVGQAPEAVKFSPDGKFLAVAIMNGSEKAKTSPFFNDAGKLLLYRVDGTRLIGLAAAWIGHWPQGIAFSPDNRVILVGNMVEREVQVLHWDEISLRDLGERIKVSGGSAALRTADKP